MKPGSAPGEGDDLRSRMRQRLAMNQAAGRGALSVTGVGASPTGQAQAGHSEVSQMVWNSVMESLSTNSALFNATTTEPRPAEQPLLARPVPSPAFEPQPLYPDPPTSASEQQAIADLFAPGATPQFGTLSVPAVAPLARAFDDLPTVAPAPVLLAPYAPAAATPTTVTPAVMAAPDGLPGMVVPAIPVLAQPVRTPAAPRPTQTRYGEGLPTLTPPAAAKKKRRPFRVLFSLLLVIALLGGAGFAGWYYFLKNKVTWAGDVKPLATFVEKTVHREFTAKVPVVTLSTPEYEVKLGIEVLARTYAGADGNLSALNAVGLATGEPAPSTVGHLVSTTTTSFYRASDKTIYRLDGSTAVYEVSMVRALTVALADQDVQWSKEWPTLTDSQRVGYSALIDGIAERVVLAKFKEDPALASTITIEMQSRFAATGTPAKDFPVYLASVVGSTENGGSGFPAAPETDLMKDLAAPPSDGAVFDLTRAAAPKPVEAAPVATGDSTNTRELGMQFWYETMYPVLGADGARAAALLWYGDSSTTTVVNGQACLTSTITTATPEAQVALATALGQWGVSRPASSKAAITSQTGNGVAVSVCAPTEPAQEPVAGDGADRLYSAARMERTFADQLVLLGLPATATSWSCAVMAYRGGSAAHFEVGSTDPALVTAMNGVLSFCKGV